MRLTGVITKEDDWYVARCLELDVISQGRTIEEAQANLKEAVELYLESFGEAESLHDTTTVILYPLEVAVGP